MAIVTYDINSLPAFLHSGVWENIGPYRVLKMSGTYRLTNGNGVTGNYHGGYLSVDLNNKLFHLTEVEYGALKKTFSMVTHKEDTYSLGNVFLSDDGTEWVLHDMTTRSKSEECTFTFFNPKNGVKVTLLQTYIKLLLRPKTEYKTLYIVLGKSQTQYSYKAFTTELFTSSLNAITFMEQNHPDTNYIIAPVCFTTYVNR